MDDHRNIVRESLYSVKSVLHIDGLGNHLSNASYRMDIFIQIMANLSERYINPKQIKTNINNINFNVNDKNELFKLLPYNVAIFSKNKHHHSKIHQRFFKPDVKKWILLFDKRPTVFDDFQSLYLIRDVDDQGYVRIQYTEQEMNQKARIENPVKELKDMLTDGRRRSVDYLKTLQRFHFPIQKHPTRLMNVPENSEILRTPSDAQKQMPMNPTKAGVLSRIKHAYDRKIEKWTIPQNKRPSLSRTRTFTRVRIRPEEHFTKEQRMEFLKAFGGGGKEIGITSPETSLAPKQRLRRVFGLDSRKKARDEYRALAQM